jgi:hypothetical protein
MSDPAADLGSEWRRMLAESRQRLGALADRLEALRQRLAPAAGAAELHRAAPFGGADARAIDDLELTFKAVDIEAPDPGKAP